MRLRHTYEVKKRKIVIELATEGFTERETKALDMLGEPLIAFQKTYQGGYTISLSKKIRSEFRTRIKIDGSDDIELANKAGNDFLDDIKEALHDAMEKLMESYDDQEFPPRSASEELTNY